MRRSTEGETAERIGYWKSDCLAGVQQIMATKMKEDQRVYKLYSRLFSWLLLSFLHGKTILLIIYKPY